MGYLKHNKEEHDKAKKIAKKIDGSTDNKEKKKLFKDLYIMIYSHHKAEEEVIFPVIMERLSKKEDKDVVREMIEEHSLASFQFSTVNQTLLDNDTWDAKFTTLMEVVEHHMDEEEDTFTKLGKEVLEKEEDEALLEEFESSMDKYEKEMKEKLKS